MQCLICLDDYQPEEDIRVMSCRHAFHQTCVDEWLQTGRNNCPACRTTVRPKSICFSMQYLSHFFLSALGRDDRHRQLHILISYIKTLAISFHEPKKHVSWHIGHVFSSPFFNFFAISDPFPVVRFISHFCSCLAPRQLVI